MINSEHNFSFGFLVLNNDILESPILSVAALNLGGSSLTATGAGLNLGGTSLTATRAGSHPLSRYTSSHHQQPAFSLPGPIWPSEPIHAGFMYLPAGRDQNTGPVEENEQDSLFCSLALTQLEGEKQVEDG